MAGRPTIRTPSNRAAALRWAAYGLSDAEVARGVGISAPALCEWKKADQEFANDLARARIEGGVPSLKKLNEAIAKGESWAVIKDLKARFRETHTERLDIAAEIDVPSKIIVEIVDIGGDE